jgi:hypothetical protein
MLSTGQERFLLVLSWLSSRLDIVGFWTAPLEGEQTWRVALHIGYVVGYLPIERVLFWDRHGYFVGSRLKRSPTYSGGCSIATAALSSHHDILSNANKSMGLFASSVSSRSVSHRVSGTHFAARSERCE